MANVLPGGAICAAEVYGKADLSDNVISDPNRIVPGTGPLDLGAATQMRYNPLPSTTGDSGRRLACAVMDNAVMDNAVTDNTVFAMC
jgi:hypothetical protein